MMKKIILILLAALLLSGCTRKIYVETVRTDTIYKHQVERDSIHIHDSIYIRDKGDTVWVERWHTAWREKLRIDTLWQSRVDSIAVPYEVEKVVEVEKPLSWWQQTRMKLGDVLLLAVAAVLGWFVYVKFAKKM